MYAKCPYCRERYTLKEYPQHLADRHFADRAVQAQMAVQTRVDKARFKMQDAMDSKGTMWQRFRAAIHRRVNRGQQRE